MLQVSCLNLDTVKAYLGLTKFIAKDTLQILDYFPTKV